MTYLGYVIEVFSFFWKNGKCGVTAILRRALELECVSPVSIFFMIYLNVPIT